MDRIEVELSESPAAPANDTSVWSIGDSLAWNRPLFSNIGHLVEHLGRCPVAQSLMGSLIVVELEVGARFPPGIRGVRVSFQVHPSYFTALHYRATNMLSGYCRFPSMLIFTQ